MITRKHSKFFLLFKATRRSATTCTLKRDPPPLNTTSVSSSSSSDHKLLCFSLVEQLLDRGLMSSAQKVFQRMIAQSTSVSDAISVADFAIVRGMDLDLGGYGALIAKLIEFDQPRMVLSLYLSNIAATGRLQDAYDHFEIMQREDVRPNQVTFTILINGHIIDGDIDNAIRLFNKMSADGFPPDRIAHNTLLKGLSQSGRLPDALSILYRMKKSRFFPNKVSYEHLLRYLGASYSSYAAFKFFEEMIGHSYFPRLYSLNRLICFLCEDKYLHEARLVLDTMHKIGKFPSNSTKELLGDKFFRLTEFHD